MTFGPFSEATLRLSAFVGIFLTMALLEHWAPRRRLTAPKLRRWTTNLSIVGLGMAVGRGLGLLALPLTAVGAASLADAHGWGLLHQVALPAWLEVVVTLVVLDFAVWLQHLASHRVPALWRIHRVHHADVDIDVTTALRFHPVEIGLSMLYKAVWVLLLGPPAAGVVLFEIILNGGAMFNHANLALPAGLDRPLRALIVTPDMHRVHHSVLAREHDSNYGFNLSIWDRAFGTYTAQPEEGHGAMTIGLADFQSGQPSEIMWSLGLPFRRGDLRASPPI